MPRLKILYAFQGTGNGHAARAAELVPLLKEYADVDVLCSAYNSQLPLPFSIDQQLNGLSFYYSKKGGLSYARSFQKARLFRFWKEVRNLETETYDLILNDFEPVSAYAAKNKSTPIIALSHQAAFLSSLSPRPKTRNSFAEWVFRNYAPVKAAIGFHFESYESFIQPPIIRSAIRNLQTESKDHFLVYLPAYGQKQLENLLIKVPEVKWVIF